MKRLVSDFGIRALFGSIVLLGSFGLLFMLIWQERVDPTALVGMIGSWVTGVVSGYIVSKATGDNTTGPPTAPSNP